MKKRLLFLLMLALMLPYAMTAQTFVNLTPMPKSMTVGDGELKLPSAFTVGYANSIDDEMVAEVKRFVSDFNNATGLTATAASSADGSLVQVELLPSSSELGEDGYTLSVDSEKAVVQAKTALGLFYAFQTVKKILPANVMAGVRDASVTSYALPQVDISDEPRFDYRGFMLDVSRHFFTTDEVKRMLDVMAYYKMNRFHWHLTDDQGWRVEIKKYPKLTSVGSIAPNSRFTDMYSCTQYWINQPYGPYFYTQEEIKDVVAYAKNLHIEVVPEIDMPGHFVAAMASYPEYSCDPDNPPVIWCDGGVSSNVLNVANPDAVQFVKDILSELMELFPYETIHIGGDECPTTQWESNALCQAQYEELGLSSYRELQSRFIGELSDFVKERGHKLAVWNEAITATGADTEIVQGTDATVYCWTSPEAAAQKAKSLGLKNIYTPIGPYYINRKQGTTSLDPPGAGTGSDDVKATYNQSIPAATDYGVQGTFWCEHVSDADYMEWLALPRLIAIAEAGWTPQSRRSFADFQQRMTADTLLLDYGKYKYCRYHMLVPNDGYPEETDNMTRPRASTSESVCYYRIISGGTDSDRKGRCIELLSSSSPLVSQYSSKNAQAGRLWTNTQATEGDDNYDYQWWSLEEDPSGSGKYAIVCKAIPDGSVKPTPTATSTSGRWDYDSSSKHYNFTLGANGYGQKGDNYYYTISSDQVSGQYWNSSMTGQGLAVNLYTDPASGSGGYWEFSPLEDYGWEGGTTADPIVFDGLQQGKTYVFTNAIEGFENTAISDQGASAGENLQHSDDPFANNAWIVSEAGEPQSDGTQSIKLQNVATSRCIAAVSSYTSQLGCPVTLGASAASLILQYDPDSTDYRIKIDGSSLFPLPSTGKVNAGSTISGASYDAPRLQGAAWNAVESKVLTLVCTDDQGTSIGTYQRSVPVDEKTLSAVQCPDVKNCVVEKIEQTGENTYAVTYKRNAWSVMIRCLDTHGAIAAENEYSVSVGGTFTVSQPEVEYFTYQSTDTPLGTSISPTSDIIISMVYATEAFSGVKKLADCVTSGLCDGNSYVFYDASTDDSGTRKGYRKINSSLTVNRATSVEGIDPLGVWTLESSGTKFKVKNEYCGLYVPKLVRSTATTMSEAGDSFSFTLNSDGTSWCVKGTNGQMWDGTENGNLVGWDSGSGHPIEIYQYFIQPYFAVKVSCVDESGTELKSTTTLLAAGTEWPLVLPSIDGYTLKEAEGAENYNGIINNHLSITATYAESASSVNETINGNESTRPHGIFDLQGRSLKRVSRPGIYIIDGKKTVVK